QYGYTLAAVWLFGTDGLIQNVLPHHKTDAILRIENTDRYDDRDDIRTNLIDSYERLMNFIAKHLPDKFYLEGDQRISLRDHLFREMIGNLLIHREFTNAFPAKLIIEKHKVYSENWNKPQAVGTIDPNDFSPFPKNPMIAKLFKEIGWVEELGSGVRNIFKFCELYNKHTKPEFIEGDTFKTIIPMKSSEKRSEKRSEKSSEKIIKLISRDNKITISELSNEVGIGSRAIEKQLSNLKRQKLIQRVGADKGGYWKIL
ncbi:MAG: AAA family ATPase, partial [Proteobacteria bacterium]|nr:AAA family ATPase [Pseudomonadota bacterium]